MLHSFMRSVTASCRDDLRGLCNAASLTCDTLSGADAKNGRPCGLLSFTDPF